MAAAGGENRSGSIAPSGSRPSAGGLASGARPCRSSRGEELSEPAASEIVSSALAELAADPGVAAAASGRADAAGRSTASRRARRLSVETEARAAAAGPPATGGSTSASGTSGWATRNRAAATLHRVQRTGSALETMTKPESTAPSGGDAGEARRRSSVGARPGGMTTPAWQPPPQEPAETYGPRSARPAAAKLWATSSLFEPGGSTAPTPPPGGRGFPPGSNVFPPEPAGVPGPPPSSAAVYPADLRAGDGLFCDGRVGVPGAGPGPGSAPAAAALAPPQLPDVRFPQGAALPLRVDGHGLSTSVWVPPTAGRALSRTSEEAIRRMQLALAAQPPRRDSGEGGAPPSRSGPSPSPRLRRSRDGPPPSSWTDHRQPPQPPQPTPALAGGNLVHLPPASSNAADRASALAHLGLRRASGDTASAMAHLIQIDALL